MTSSLRPAASASTSRETPCALNIVTGPVRDFGQIFDEARALRLQAVDDVAIVDDLVAHIDRRIARRERPLDDLDRPDDARAEAARLRQNNLHAETPVPPTRYRGLVRSRP